jgi:hypothetical protein
MKTTNMKVTQDAKLVLDPPGSGYEWRALVNGVMNCQGLYNVRNISNSLENVRFS